MDTKNQKRKVARILGLLLDKLEMAVQTLDVQSDRTGLKNLIAALKELLEIMEGRMDRESADQVLVKLEGVLEDYAQ